MIAVLFDCDCSKSKFTEDFIIGDNYKNFVSLTTNQVKDNTLTMGTSPVEFELVDIQTLTDSISLVCSADAKFCGDKELVLTDPNNVSVDL